MSEENFEPLTAQLGVPGTSYKIQLGLINDQWASRLVKGNSVLASNVYELDEGESSPNINYIVGWVLQTSAIPNINPHQVMKSAQALMNQAKQKMQQRASGGPPSQSTPIAATREALSEEEKRKMFQERMKARQEGQFQVESQASGTKRTLPTIPSATPSTQTKSSQAQPAISNAANAPQGDKSHFCPYCGKDLEWKYCPYCGKKLT
ncbi:MAG: hypothetical protein BAJALOKI1v1_240027 [Promethearchaeota archaeon]|nr:MAG: hypothetical protein BAJALOKI1v1_240027 [Candidatus Lokiarchaeota archaeon]